MTVMKCAHITRDGLCTSKYAGYSCIKRQCSLFKDAHKCEYHEPTGDYCRKYARFGCVGKDSCSTLADYLEAATEDGQA